MPVCPVCRIEYAPDVQFCPKDGARLAAAAVTPAPATPASPQTSPVVAVLLTMGGVAVLALAAWLGWAYFQPTSTAPSAIQPRLAETRQSPPPSSPPPGMRSAPTGTRTESANEMDSPWDEPVDEETIEEESVISPDAAPSEYEPFDAPLTAYASTEDGSRVVLRSAPTTEYGRRVARIPDEGEVEVLGCLQDLEETEGRTSAWCRVRYEGKSGWAFAGFLTTTPPTPSSP